MLGSQTNYIRAMESVEIFSEVFVNGICEILIFSELVGSFIVLAGVSLELIFAKLNILSSSFTSFEDLKTKRINELIVLFLFYFIIPLSVLLMKNFIICYWYFLKLKSYQEVNFKALVKYTVTALFGLSFLLVLALSEAVFCIKFKVLAALIDVFVVFCISVFLAFPQKTSAILFLFNLPGALISYRICLYVLVTMIY